MTASRVSRSWNEPRISRPYYQDVGRDKFTATEQNAFKIVGEAPVSTFSLDVDTASYSFVRASLNQNVLPQPAAVRTEELVNYFPYDYAPARAANQPFSTHVAVFPSPWSPGRQLVRIGVKGFKIDHATRPRANLVFLRGDRHLCRHCGHRARADAGAPQDKILAVIDRLGAGGSTAGAEGIRQAYALAAQNFDPKGVNRVILATDGDSTSVSPTRTSSRALSSASAARACSCRCSALAWGNYNDALMQTLAQNGNGAAAYIDTVSEARKTLVDEATSTLFPIARM
ncbi:von willebrand factor domain-containing protein [Ditylenchus destructor]|uniref:von willebrand factor domain-containing protein n=1 Tax=Ditylenchus destructor TaxID=166010 RepID=A0AAD4MH28_9BILA|nr:von willebrand factor domain-containing protein [Ditylenchus destructor]